MPHCAVFGCNNNTKKKEVGLKFYSFPKTEPLRGKWINACSRQDKFNFNKAYICSIHFTAKQRVKSLKSKLLGLSPKFERDLAPDAVPILLIPKSDYLECPSKRSARYEIKARKRLISDILFGKSTTNPPLSPESPLLIQESPILNPEPPVLIPESPVFVPEIVNTPESVDPSVQTPELNSIPTPRNNCDFHFTSPNTSFINIEELIEKNAQLARENEALKLELTALKSEHQKSDSNQCQAVLSRYFSSGVVRRILSSEPKNKRIKWSIDDIASAVSLRAVNAKSYKYMRNKMHLPLPSISCLKAWTRKIDFSAGILKSVLKLVEFKVKEMTPIERITVLSFDEMYLSKEICFDKKNEQVIGPYQKVQVMMARGLFSGWKQVVFYSFDTPMTKNVLCNAINDLNTTGLNVVATVCDLGSENQHLIKELDITEDSPTFCPSSNVTDQVYFFFDVPHLLKCMRNHFIDQGFIINNKTVSKRCLLKILDHTSSAVLRDLRVAHKLDKDLLFVQNIKRQNVGKAAKLFSRTNAMAIKYFSDQGIIDDESADSVSEFFNSVNNWFDLLNSSDKFDSYSGSDEQIAFIQGFTSVIRSMKIISPKVNSKPNKLLPFQKGILITNRALQGLLLHLQQKLPQNKITYIMTRRLNQDIVENFFSYIRGMGAFNDHPDPLNFITRLKWYILGKNSPGLFDSSNLNTKVDSTDSSSTFLVNPAKMLPASRNVIENEKIPLTQSLFDNIIDNKPLTHHLLGPLVDQNQLQTPQEFEEFIDDPNLMEITQKKHSSYDEARNFVAGYVAHRFRKEFPNLGVETMKLPETEKNWTSYVSKGHLLIPSDELKKVIDIADEEFLKYHGNLELQRCEKIFQIILNKTKERLHGACPISDKVLLCFIRTRTFLRLREWNLRIKNEKTVKAMSSAARGAVKKVQKYKK